MPGPTPEQRAAMEEYVARKKAESWAEAVAEHGDILWRAAAVMHRSPKLRSVVSNFLSTSILTYSQARLVYAITKDLERSDERAKAAA